VPSVDVSSGWQEAIAALAIISVAAFLVTWIVTDVLHVARTPYVAVLSMVVAVLSAGYIASSGASLVDLFTHAWGRAVIIGFVASGIVALMLRRMAQPPRRADRPSLAQFMWEGVVYGIAEGLLLATLPVLAAWQIGHDLGWTDSAVGKTSAGAVAILAALVVIGVHHLGYREFRAPAARRKLMMALISCGLQALAFLVTGNVLAPIVAHIVLHWQLIVLGVEMPPAEHPAPLDERWSTTHDDKPVAVRELVPR
jgi:hypothetical protein